MRIRYKIKVLVLSIIVIIFGICFALLANRLNPSSSPFNNNIINAISFIVSLTALALSAITYFSIDAVNSVTSMSGNILENPYYNVTTSSAIQAFLDCETYEQYEKKLFEIVEPSLISTSCMSFADEIQCVVDNLIWFHDIKKTNKNIKKINRLVNKLKARQRLYNKLSNGINYLLDENIKLIEHNLEFQIFRNSSTVHNSWMSNVRGDLLVNPVSQIIYNDYIALDYSKQARRLLDVNGLNKDFSLESLITINEMLTTNSYGTHYLKRVEVLVKTADMYFDKAMAISKGNVLWEGYILCNIARTKLYLYILNLNNITEEDVIRAYEQVIEVKTVEYYLSFIDNSDSFIKEKYKFRLTQMKEEKKDVCRFIDYKNQTTTTT